MAKKIGTLGALGVAFAVGGAAPAFSEETFPYRIGVLADSQITTPQGSFNYGMRRKMADRVSSVAIRPPAVEYLAPLMLQRFLDKMKAEKVDLILYLGDGANSGCRDELDMFFRVLENARANGGPPSYFVLGNHDYLGTGNQSHMEFRKKLCAADGVDNPPETKLQVIERMERHNKASAALDSNFMLETRTVDSDHAKSESCVADDRGQYTKFHVEVLKSRTGTPVDILLADSSDYRDVSFSAYFGEDCEAIGLWGVKGSVSFGQGNSQISVLAEMANPAAKYRLIASHYWPFNWNMILPFNKSGSLVRDDLVRLVAKGQKTIWVGGHTHRAEPKVDVLQVGKTLSGPTAQIDAINVGSTTDKNPHGLILGPATKQEYSRIRKSSVGYTTVLFPRVAADCERVDAQAAKLAGDLRPVCSAGLKSALGIDRSYQDSCFKSDSAAIVRANIDSFSARAAPLLDMAPDDIKACLAFAGSANESAGGRQPQLRPVPAESYRK